MKKEKTKKEIFLPTPIKTIIVIDILLALFLLFIGISFFASSMEIKNNTREATTQFMAALENYPSLNMSAEQAREYILRVAEVAPYIATFLIVLAILQGIVAIYLWKRNLSVL